LFSPIRVLMLVMQDKTFKHPYLQALGAHT